MCLAAEVNLWAKLSTFLSLPTSIFQPTSGCDDFEKHNITVNFPTGAREVSVTVSLSLRDDNYAEPTKVYTLYVDVPHDPFFHMGVVPLENATITVTDDDGECCLNTPYSTEHNQNMPIDMDCL